MSTWVTFLQKCSMAQIDKMISSSSLEYPSVCASIMAWAYIRTLTACVYFIVHWIITSYHGQELIKLLSLYYRMQLIVVIQTLANVSFSQLIWGYNSAPWFTIEWPTCFIYLFAIPQNFNWYPRISWKTQKILSSRVTLF